MKKMFSAVILGVLVGLCGTVQANTITFTGSINSANTIDDWYFNLNTGSAATVSVRIYADMVDGGGFDSYIYLLTNNYAGISNETILTYDDDSGDGLESLISTSLASGSYQVSISDFDYTTSELLSGTNSVSGDWRYEISIFSYCGTLTASQDASPVPEPATMLLFGTGVVGLAAVGRRKVA